MKELTHKQACRRMAGWLKMTKNHKVVITELSTAAGETPDVLSFHNGCSTTLIEVKVSRSDFLADKHKTFRRDTERGMGMYRYFAAPKGMLKADEMPEGWGLYEFDDRFVTEIKKSERHTPNRDSEIIVLVSVMRRLEIATCVYVVSEGEPQREGAGDE